MMMTPVRCALSPPIIPVPYSVLSKSFATEDTEKVLKREPRGRLLRLPSSGFIANGLGFFAAPLRFKYDRMRNGE